MLHLVNPRESRLNRRAFLSTGALALGGLPALLQAQEKQRKLIKDRAVVFVFMHGGPSQYETFDPKMDAPSGIRSQTGEIPTTLPGITFGATFPRLARLAHKMAVVRSFSTGDGNHDIKPIVGRHTLGANLGTLYSRVAGATAEGSGMPRNVALFPPAVDAKAQPAVTQFGNFLATGPMSPAFSPFPPGAGGDLQNDMRLNISPTRLEDRRSLLAELDGARRTFDQQATAESLNGFQQQAFSTLFNGLASAFDLSKEDPRTLARYDTAPLVRPESIRKVWNNHERYRDHSQSIGKLMLLARRLCERGAGFVTVTSNFVWDMHADTNNATVTEGMGYVGAPFDHAISAFIEDVEARGLSEKILLVCCGEMGRTPKVNARGGRDHWGKIAPLMIYGGGLKMGQVVGQSSKDGGEPATEPVMMENLTATILHSLFDIGLLRLEPNLSSEVLNVMTGYQPIGQLM